jgi:hypothetical protein
MLSKPFRLEEKAKREKETPSKSEYKKVNI